MKKVFYIQRISPLYEAVQASGLFPDSKFFPDCRPLFTPKTILRAYEKARTEPDFDLKTFVAQHFETPKTPETGYQSGEKPIIEHLNGLWDVLTRQADDSEARASTLLPLPKSYIVPGGRFREVYYWDSYFTLLGLKTSGRTDLVRNMVGNFAHLIDTLGFVPNGNRSYYLGRSQPPFFALMLSVLAEMEGEQVWAHYGPSLEKEYRFWMRGAAGLSAENPCAHRVVRLADGVLLNRYWDEYPEPRPEAWAEDVHVAHLSKNPSPETYRHIRAAAESGWDFSSRWFADGQNMETIHTTDFLPIDLNCLLWFLEKTLAEVFAKQGKTAKAKRYEKAANSRKTALQRYFYDEERGFYLDYDHKTRCLSNIPTLAAVFPLFFGLAEPAQAAATADFLQKNFLHAGGLRTTLQNTGQQWDAPNGWAPLQWMAFRGLKNYDFDPLADEVRARWMRLCEKTYAETGKMMEKYNVSDLNLKAGGGEYPNQDGFGWTNGVYLGFFSCE